MSEVEDCTTYMVEINGAAPREMPIATPYMECAASAVPGVFGIQEEEFPLHIRIWIEDLVSDRNPPSEWLIFEPGAALSSLVTDSEGGMHSVTGLGSYFLALARGPADLRDYLVSGRTVWRQDGQAFRRCAV